MREKGIGKKERGKGENGTLARKEKEGKSKRVLKREEGFMAIGREWMHEIRYRRGVKNEGRGGGGRGEGVKECL